MRVCVQISAALIVLACSNASGQAASGQEDFAADPVSRGWRTAGAASLFQWNATAQHLEVTWDSRLPNSFFAWPLGTVLSKDDSFSLAFDLELSDVTVGIDPSKPYSFELAVGFIRLAQATAPGYYRGTGTDSPNLLEFDYFPDSGFGATIAPTVISTNMQFASSFNFPLELIPGIGHRIELIYSAGNRTLTTRLTRLGAPLGPVEDVVLKPEFTDFRLDHLAVCSYSDAGQSAGFAGSVLAHGAIDNLSWELPEGPVRQFTGAVREGQWQLEFVGQTNWLYTIETSADLSRWETLAPAVAGTGDRQTVTDTRPLTGRAFYRLRADRP